MLTHSPANHVFDGPITTLLSILWILIEILSHAYAQMGVNGFKFGTFIDCFQSDGVASIAVNHTVTSAQDGLF